MRRKELDKHLIMRVGVTFFFVLILFFWLSNITNIFTTPQKTSPNDSQYKWEKIQTDLKKIIKTTEKNIDSKKEEKTVNNNNKESDKLINDLMKTTKETSSSKNKKASSSLEQKSVPSSQDKLNCPQWINCMPTIGSAPRTCQVPRGCEGITQIAY